MNEAIPERVWAIEGAQGLGLDLAQFLLARGESVVDVPSFLSARVRELSRGGRRKTDAIDAGASAPRPSPPGMLMSCTRWQQRTSPQ